MLDTFPGERGNVPPEPPGSEGSQLPPGGEGAPTLVDGREGALPGPDFPPREGGRVLVPNGLSGRMFGPRVGRLGNAPVFPLEPEEPVVATPTGGRGALGTPFPLVTEPDGTRGREGDFDPALATTGRAARLVSSRVNSRGARDGSATRVGRSGRFRVGALCILLDVFRLSRRVSRVTFRRASVLLTVELGRETRTVGAGEALRGARLEVRTTFVPDEDV